MTKFADSLYDDLMRQHGALLTQPQPQAAAQQKTQPSTRARRVTPRRALVAAGTAGVAVAATVTGLVVGSGSPAYALTTNPNGTITLDVYQTAGVAQANAKLHELGDNVVVVPIQAGCPRPRPPAVSPIGKLVQLGIRRSPDGSITVQGHAPAGDLIVVGFTADQPHHLGGLSALSSPPAPTCLPPAQSS
jgi:hypothetical protein